MNNAMNTYLCQKPLRLTTSKKICDTCFIAGFALMLSSGPTQLGAATSVQAEDELAKHLEKATATDYSFTLEGDVNMAAALTLNGTQKKNIAIDGAYGADSRAVITRQSEHYRFNVGSDGNMLLIQNAIIKQASGTNGYGAIHVTAKNSTLNLHNTTFTGNTAEDSMGLGGALSLKSNTNTTVDGNVAFIRNNGKQQAGGAVGIYGASESSRSTVNFTGETHFEGNSTVYYGGALVANYYADVVFQEKASFHGNYATKYFGGAVDLYGGKTHVTFKKDAEFIGNYVKNSGGDYYGIRGGAINVGYIDGTDSPHLNIEGTATFTDNYVWGSGTTKAYGGALSMMSGGADPDSKDPGHGGKYEAMINQGIFHNNIAYSENANAYGGAIFTKTQSNVLTLGSGSSFTNNYAKTLGGAIYFDQGTLNLNGNILFEGNRHGASFNTSSGRPAYVAGSGKANAIYFAVSSNPAQLNLNAGAGEVIHFADPIESANKKMVTVNKTGAGTVLFTEHRSDILAKTSVVEGIFELGAGAAYGRAESPATSSFSLSSNATLKGGSGAHLVASTFDLAGRIEVYTGEFTFSGGNLSLYASSVVSLAIESADNYSSINLTGASINLNDASLEITAVNYVPSQNISDEFTIVSNIAEQNTGMFLQGDSIMINGAKFAITYGSNAIVLNQLTVPEPSTYAAFIGIAIVALVGIRRVRRKA